MHVSSSIPDIDTIIVLGRVSIAAMKQHFQKVSRGKEGLIGLYFHITAHHERK